MTVEYSANVTKTPDAKAFLKDLNETLVSCGPYGIA
jgi:5-carboxymethyl-2-hydroxymuconate isomerase